MNQLYFMNEKVNYILQWIEKGDHDLGTARIIREHLPEYYDTIAFHCQQAAEKYLKGWMVFHDMAVPRIHDLTVLLQYISTMTEIEEELFQKAYMLNAFSVDVRYPETVITLSESDIREALDIAWLFRKQVLEHSDLAGKVKDLP